MARAVRQCDRRWFLGSAAALTIASVACESREPPHIAVSLRGAGASFPSPLYERWFLEYGRLTGTTLVYKASGSSDGIQAILTDRTDFAGTDIPMDDDELAQAGDVIHVPMTLGAVAIVYNLPDGPSALKLDGPTLARIFLGDVTT